MTPQYAGFWKRFAAFLIDVIILGTGIFILRAILLLLFPNRGSGFAFFLVFAAPISLIFGWIYYAVMESTPVQATLGKMILGIKVTGIKCECLSFGRATARYFAKIFSAVFLCLGFLMAAWTQKKQGLHDIIAGTLVIKK
jgi:uncharacterized RDD family membrane protein YckC